MYTYSNSIDISIADFSQPNEVPDTLEDKTRIQNDLDKLANWWCKGTGPRLGPILVNRGGKGQCPGPGPNPGVQGSVWSTDQLPATLLALRLKILSATGLDRADPALSMRLDEMTSGYLPALFFCDSTG